MNQRDIYYRHPDLFVKQTVVDRYVNDLACTFGISRSQLNVVCILTLSLIIWVTDFQRLQLPKVLSLATSA